MKQINENSTKKAGEYITLKEARKVAREVCPEYSVVLIFAEKDGTFSINVPSNHSIKPIEAVDKSGRRYSICKRHGEIVYVSKK